MSKVFLSWGSPDKTIATALATRLKHAGLDVFFSDIDMHPGDNPNARVPVEINEALLSIFALSDESVSRPWVGNELTLAWGAMRTPNLPMKRVIPIVVGSLSDAKIPRPLVDEHLHRADFIDLTDHFEEKLEDLLMVVADELRTVAPVILPAALFAMTARQFEELCATAEEAVVDKIITCLVAAGAPLNGISDATLEDKREKIRTLFDGVYKDRSEDFDPFRDGEGVRRLLDRAAAGQRRERRVTLRWDDERLRDEDGRTEAWFQRDRKARSCLTVVDSLSVFHHEVRELLSEVPRPDNKKQDALLWIPPYRSPEMDAATQGLTRTPHAVLDAFLDWTEPTGRWVAFHTSTPASLNQWAVRAVDELARRSQDTPPPVDEHVDEMEETFGRGQNPRDMMRTSRRR